MHDTFFALNHSSKTSSKAKSLNDNVRRHLSKRAILSKRADTHFGMCSLFPSAT